MKFAGDNLTMDAVPEKGAGRSRKAALAVLLHGLMKKTGEILMIRVRCNLIMSAQPLGMRIKGWLKRWTEVKKKFAGNGFNPFPASVTRKTIKVINFHQMESPTKFAGRQIPLMSYSFNSAIRQSGNPALAAIWPSRAVMGMNGIHNEKLFFRIYFCHRFYDQILRGIIRFRGMFFNILTDNITQLTQFGIIRNVECYTVKSIYDTCYISHIMRNGGAVMVLLLLELLVFMPFTNKDAAFNEVSESRCRNENN
jgi:hypothetical protein